MNDIIKVPFGKYKDQEIQDMLSDDNYVSWLKNQGWVKVKYPIVFNIIQQIHLEDQPTPEHNAMQIKWLDKEYQRNFLIFYNTNFVNEEFSIKFEKYGFDLFLRSMSYIINSKLGTNYDEYVYFFIELKPSISDNYPTILRKIEGNRKSIIYRHRDKITLFYVITKEFVSESITLNQVKEYFESNNIKFLLESEFEEDNNTE